MQVKEKLIISKRNIYKYISSWSETIISTKIRNDSVEMKYLNFKLTRTKSKSKVCCS